MNRRLHFLCWAAVAASLVPCLAHAADTIHAKSSVEQATVFFKGATVTRSVELAVPKGNSYIYFEGLPFQLEAHSLQVKSPKNVAIRSVQPEQLEQTSTKETKLEKQLQDQIDSIEVAIAKFKKDIQVLNQEEFVLNKNQEMDRRRVTAESLETLADFYHKRFNQIETSLIDIELAIEAAQDHAREIIEDINQTRLNRLKPSTRVFTRVYSEVAQKVRFQIVYFTDAAGWDPAYDFEVTELNEPITLRYKADVYQQTGEPWKKVKLKLTTADPTHDARIPEERIWYIQNGRPQPTFEIKKQGQGELKGKVINTETGEPIPFVNVVVQKDGKLIAGAASDFDGVYYIKPIEAGRYTVKASAMGMNSVQVTGVNITNNRTQFLDLKMGNSVAMLDEVQIVAYKAPVFERDQTVTRTTITKDDLVRMPARSAAKIASSSGDVYSYDYYGRKDLSVRGSREEASHIFIDGTKVRGADEASSFQTIQLNALADKANVNLLEYEISTPYTINSVPISTQLDLKEVEIPVDYKFHVYPTADVYAHLVAHIGDWQSLHLFPGLAGIYYQNTYVGKTDVKDFSARDTLKLIIGRDYDIITKKTPLKEYTERISLGNSYKQYIGWEYQLINKKDRAVNVVVHDQLPTSNSKEIRIEVEELGGAHVDKRFFTRWDKQLEPHASETIPLKYYIRYPKYMRIEL